MSRYDYDICVIGGGSAGLSAASGASQLGMKTLLVEREPELGGDCLHYGCVPSKTLLSAARSWHGLGRTGELGLPAVERPPLDFSAVARRIRETIAAIQPHDSPERFARLGVRTVFGQARLADEHSVDTGQERVSARFIVLATGSEAAVPPLPGLDATPLWTNRDLFSLTELPESLAILGGGAIACEMAQAFARFGVRVTLVQRSPHVLSSEDGDMAGLVQQALAEDGVDLRTGADIRETAPDGTDGGVVVRLERGGRAEEVRAARMLVALGRRANVQDLGLDEAGVEHSARGVGVDARLRTTHRHIFAAGDVTGAHQFTHAAGYEAGVVVANAAFRLPRKADYRLMPHCTYTDPELASIGLNEKRARAEGVEHSVRVEEFSANDRALAEGRGKGRLKLVLDHRGRPLGVQICGPRAGDLLAEWVAVLGGGVRLSTLAGAVHPYPTLAEISKKAAGSVISEKLFSDRVRSILRLLFRYQGPAVEPEDPS